MGRFYFLFSVGINCFDGIIWVNSFLSHFKGVNFGFNVFLVYQYGWNDFRGNLSRFLGVCGFGIALMLRHKNYSIPDLCNGYIR